MKIIVTGAGGLIGSEATKYFLKGRNKVSGIDNNTRMKLFGKKGTVQPVINELSKNKNYTHFNIDITHQDLIENTIKKIKPDVLIHCAAQPSHDKAASVPYLDFSINANGTLNLLESCRKYAKDCIFIHVSTNKVYGDAPNNLPLIEFETRYDHCDFQFKGINEKCSIDQSKHSLFGASKVAADILAQEYGRYFDMPIGIFRGGCLTGPQHAGVELHGFLSYIVKCAKENKPYTIFGYKGKQVRDQIHCEDVISAFAEYIENPQPYQVYNIGGEKENSASILETIDLIKEISGLELNWKYDSFHRSGDHVCYYTDMTKFKIHFPSWNKKWSLKDIISQMLDEEKGEKYND